MCGLVQIYSSELCVVLDVCISRSSLQVGRGSQVGSSSKADCCQTASTPEPDASADLIANDDIVSSIHADIVSGRPLQGPDDISF